MHIDQSCQGMLCSPAYERFYNCLPHNSTVLHEVKSHTLIELYRRAAALQHMTSTSHSLQPHPAPQELCA
jgi:hypothetical protein